MAPPARLRIQVDRVLHASRPACDLIDEHVLIKASGRTSFATLLRQHCETSARAPFFDLGPQDFQTIAHVLTVVVKNFKVVEEHTNAVVAKGTTLAGAGEIVVGALYAADNYACGAASATSLAQDLRNALEKLKTMCARLIGQRTVRSKVLCRSKSEIHQLIQHAQVPSTLDDLLQGDESTDDAEQKLAAFLTCHGDVKGDVQKLFQTLKERMVPRNLPTRSRGNVYECVRPLRHEILTGLMPMLIFELPTSRMFVTNLNGICAQRARVA